MKMTKTMSLGLAVVGASLLASLGAPSVSHAAPPACVARLIANVSASFHCDAPGMLVIHRKNDTWVSYTPASFRADAAGHPVSAKSPQTFSDRCTTTSCAQNFARSKADSHTITINKDTGRITILNHTWNFSTSLQASCDGDVIKATDASFVYTLSHRSGSLGAGVCVK